MKPIKRILYLSFIVLAIGAFWLIPKINTAKNVQYVITNENERDRPSVKVEEVKMDPRRFNPENSGEIDLDQPVIAKGNQLIGNEQEDELNADKKLQGSAEEVMSKEAGSNEQESVAKGKKHVSKKAKKDRIHNKMKFEDVKVCMYSRAIHFEPELLTERDTVTVLP